MLKAQAASESLIILGFITVMLVPLIFYFFIFSSENLFSISEYQTLNLINQICDNAAEVWYSGPNTSKRAILYFPTGLKALYVGSGGSPSIKLFIDPSDKESRKIVAELEFYGLKKTFVDYCPCPISNNLLSSSLEPSSSINYKNSPNEIYLPSGLVSVSFTYTSEKILNSNTQINYILIKRE
ncbi:MAG: hypothetical protein QXV83_04055 [Candidatus Anstonellaceae archaeon]